MKDLVLKQLSDQFLVKVYGVEDKFSNTTVNTDSISPLGKAYANLNLVRVVGFEFLGELIPAISSTLLVLPGKGESIDGDDPFGNKSSKVWVLKKDEPVGNINISSETLEDLIPEKSDVTVLATRLQIKDYSYTNGVLKARIEWELSAGPFSYSDHLDINVKTGLGGWTKVGQVGPVKVYVKMPELGKICAKAEVKVGWPINSTLRATECIKL